MTIRPAERYPRISIHALREEGDPGTGGRRCRALSFLSTPSARRATRVRQSERDYEEQFLSTPSARRATSSPSSLGMEIFISIHALREEGDIWERTEERTDEYFYPRPLRGGRLPGFFLASETGKISIHALREEGDAGLRMFHLQWQEFLSTPSARRATSKRSWQSGWPRGFLSTPSARRATFFSVVLHPAQSDFYPRPPRGGRQTVDLLIVDDLGFLSTPSARRATRSCRRTGTVQRISIHALREEGDMLPTGLLYLLVKDFYPRPPRGGRRQSGCNRPHQCRISIHALREEGDLRRWYAVLQTPISIHALREEGDSKNRDKISIFKQIIQHSARI